MSCYPPCTAIIATVITALGTQWLGAKEPPQYYRPKLSTVVELELATGRTKTISEHQGQTLSLLDHRNGVLLGVEFGRGGLSRMIGLSAESGKVLWSLATNGTTWEHFFDGQYVSEPRDFGFTLPNGEFAKPPGESDQPFFGLAGDKLAGIDIHTGRVLWQISPPKHYNNQFAWRAIFGLRDHVAAAIRGRVRIVDRALGQVVLDLKPKSAKSFYMVDQPVETDEFILLAFDNGEDQELVRWSKRSGKLESRVDSGSSVVRLLAATDKLVLTKEQGVVVARDIQNLRRVHWRQKRKAWFDPGARAIVWRNHLVTRSSDLPTIDLRDGSVFPLFHQPRGREIQFSNYLWAVHNETLFTVSPAGILRWNKKSLQSQGTPSLGSETWTPASEAADSKRPPHFVDCLMTDGKAYLVLVHQWHPEF